MSLRIKELREEENLTQKQLAEKLVVVKAILLVGKEGSKNPQPEPL